MVSSLSVFCSVSFPTSNVCSQSLERSQGGVVNAENRGWGTGGPWNPPAPSATSWGAACLWLRPPLPAWTLVPLQSDASLLL